MEVFGPLVCSSVVATLTIRQFLGADPLYTITHFVLSSPTETLVLLGLGCVCGLLSPLYMLILRSVESWFSLWHGPAIVRVQPLKSPFAKMDAQSLFLLRRWPTQDFAEFFRTRCFNAGNECFFVEHNVPVN